MIILGNSNANRLQNGSGLPTVVPESCWVMQILLGYIQRFRNFKLVDKDSIGWLPEMPLWVEEPVF